MQTNEVKSKYDAENHDLFFLNFSFIHGDLAARNILVGENSVSQDSGFWIIPGQEVYVKKERW